MRAAAVCSLTLFTAYGQISPAAETITIDARARGTPFPHFWETMFGSGRAVLSLRESYHRDLRAVRSITNFEYVRFHAILHDEVGLYDEDAQGHPLYNFSYIDQIYDGLREEGVRPMVELSFMPRKLAASDRPHAFWYKPLVSPPKDYGRWGELIYELAKHLVSRYGGDEVSHWYFEIWNEPNIDFWTGEPKEATYYQLYDQAARSIKRVDSRLRVGGPATAQAAWVGGFIRHCVDGRVPVDFVSTHVYANDKAEDVFGTHESIPRSEMVARAVKKVYDEVKSSGKPDLPILWTEFNASYMNEVNVTDSPYMGPWLANTIRQCDGYVATMAYWTFSDAFEEQGVVKRPFYGGFGLIAAGNIPKASFNVFRLLHDLGTERLRVDSNSAIVTRRANGSLGIALWNYAPPDGAGEAKEMTLALRGIDTPHRARIRRVDHDHGSALTAWEAMGRPDFPTREQQEQLRKAGESAPPEIRRLRADASVKISIPPQGLALVEIVR